MSLKGIDAQIMIQRTADYSKDSAAMSRKNELMMDYMKVQGQAEEAFKRSSVQEAENKQDVLITDEREGDGTGYQSGEGDRYEATVEDADNYEIGEGIEDLSGTSGSKFDVRV